MPDSVSPKSTKQRDPGSTLITFPQIPMQYSLKLTFWDRLLQAQHVQEFGDGTLGVLPDHNAPFSELGGDQCFDVFPEMAREKFYQSGALFCAGNIVASLNLAFQALQICSFTLGSNHPALSVVMQHIATICESQGLRFEAQRMRREALEIVAHEHYRTSAEASYLH